MKHGKLIVFEGVSGTGKETQAKRLQQFLEKRGITARIVFHPSPELKPLLKKASVRQQIELLTKDRKKMVDALIIPALRKGEWVIGLRNYISAYVYQGNGKTIEAFDPKPDYLFYFDISPQDAMKRIIKRGEVRGTYETMELLTEKRKKYKEVLSHISLITPITLNAAESIDEIHKNIVKYIL